MFKKMPPAIKIEYKQYKKEHWLLYGFHVFLIFMLSVIAPFLFWSGMRMFDEVGGLIFRTLDEAEHPLGYSALFITLVVLERVCSWLLKRTRSRELFQTLHYMEHRFYTLIANPATERAAACKKAFGEVLDRKLNLARLILSTVTLAFFTCWANYYAGPPLIALYCINSLRGMKGKEQNKWLRLTTNLVQQGYFLSTILLMVFHVYSYGGIFGFYCAILVRTYLEKELVQDLEDYKTHQPRLDVLAEAFDERIPFDDTKKMKTKRGAGEEDNTPEGADGESVSAEENKEGAENAAEDISGQAVDMGSAVADGESDAADAAEDTVTQSEGGENSGEAVPAGEEAPR